MDQNELSHVGVLGMKWGHRKARTKVANLPPHSENRAPVSETRLKEMQLQKKKLSELTTTELKAVNERIQLEKTYASLTKKETSPGMKFVTDVLLGAGKQVATTYVAKYMGKGLDALLKEPAVVKEAVKAATK